MTYAEKLLLTLVCFLVMLVGAGAYLLGRLTYLNATSPAYTVESCVEVKVKRSEP